MHLSVGFLVPLAITSGNYFWQLLLAITSQLCVAITSGNDPERGVYANAADAADAAATYSSVATTFSPTDTARETRT